MDADISWHGPAGRVHRKAPVHVDAKKGVFRVLLPKHAPEAEILVEVPVEALRGGTP